MNHIKKALIHFLTLSFSIVTLSFGQANLVSASTIEKNSILPSSPKHFCAPESTDGTNDYGQWDYVLFGSYPQEEITNPESIKFLDQQYNLQNIEKGDLWYNNQHFRRIDITDTCYPSKFNDMQNSPTYRYFLWSPIKWKVLSVNDSEMFLLSDLALDMKNYDNSVLKDRDDASWCNWGNVTLRSWLNGYTSDANKIGESFVEHNFISDAFTSAELESIVSKEITYMDLDHEIYSCNDKVFLPDAAELSNINYGFCEDISHKSESRFVLCSDYCYRNGGYSNGAIWFTREPGPDYRSVCAPILNTGNIYGPREFLTETGGDCIVPAIVIKTTSNVWKLYCEHTNTTLKNQKTADCKNEGYTGDEICNRCGEIAKEGSIIPQTNNHQKLITINKKAPTCTEDGYDGDQFCEYCQQIVTRSEKTIPKLNHPEKTLQGVKKANCIHTGYTGDLICNLCKTIVTKGKTIPTTNKHVPGKPVEEELEIGNTYHATSYESVIYCTLCKKELSRKTVKLPAPKNTKLKYNDLVYMIISTNKNAPKVKVTGLRSTNTDEIEIPATIKVDTVKYTVTKIDNSAFTKLNKNLKKVTIGKNIDTIGKKAFYGCKKLSHIRINTIKLTDKKVGSSAFAKCADTLTVKVPKDKLKAYKKLLKAKGISGKKQRIISK